jgi:vitamin B12/bleomycin/antimicrobial peptide transport system ATP-binding/permease protein
MPRENNSDGRHPSPLLRFWASARGFWRGKSAWTSWGLSFGLVAMALAQLAVQYRLNYWNRNFFNALERRDADGLWDQAVIFVPLACMSIALQVSAVWGRMTTQRKWREWLTTYILGIWLTQQRYRYLNSATGEYANAEYRIVIDTRMATDAPVDLALGLVNAILTAVVFLGVLWQVGGSFTIVTAGIEMTVPGYLVVGVVVYALTFTSVMMAIGRHLPVVIQMENQAEAELLAIANQFRESVNHAKPTSADDRHHLAWDALRQVLKRWRQLCWQLMGTTFVTQTDLLLAPVFAWILCAPKFLSGAMTLGELTQASAAFVTVQVAFNWLVDNYPRLSDWRSAATRVAALLLALDHVAPSPAASSPSDEKSG